MAAGGGTKAVVTAMIANGGIAIAKFVAYLFTGSSSMLAESIHSVADTSNQGLLLLGGKRARKIADDRHQFGYGRERYFWAFVVALVLFSVGGGFSVYEGINKIRDPHEIESVAWAFGVLSFAIVAEAFAFRTAFLEAKKVRGTRTWWQYLRSARSPEIPVILLEDTGALLGLVLAMGGVGLTVATGDPIWDGIGTLCIGVLLIVIAAFLTWEMKSLLIGEAATDTDTAAIVRAVGDAPDVTRIIDLRTQHIGPEEVLVAGKIEFTRGLTNTQLSDAIDTVEAAVRDAVPHDLQIYLEPDLYEADYVDADDVGPDDATLDHTQH
ncbi:cation diffusion facilitator family transporter [Salsipaludibacter albus]|uniref:cation diffusion facilitator family transporter n=1 Tax=Salsipaludibacter albus TaxID=2849650 RepID=UPI001EE3C119|nr:cation diffusion facilitator family transporter [Salsipaludibacter albus]